MILSGLYFFVNNIDKIELRCKIDLENENSILNYLFLREID